MATATASRTTTVENIKVLQVGQFGVRVAEKTWFGVNEPLTPQHFQVGEGYKVSVVTSKTGKKYINEVLGKEVTDGPQGEQKAETNTEADAETIATKVQKTQVSTDSKRSNPVRAGFGQPLTEYDLALQRQISRAGVYQAALQSSAAIQWSTSMDEYLSNVRKLADAGLEYVNE